MVKIDRITAKHRCCGQDLTWSRQTIGNIIENIVELMRHDGRYSDIVIYYKDGSKKKIKQL